MQFCDQGTSFGGYVGLGPGFAVLEPGTKFFGPGYAPEYIVLGPRNAVLGQGNIFGSRA